MFARHLVKVLKQHVWNEYGLFRLERRFDNLRIVRPCSVKSPHRLQLGKNVLIQRNCHLHCGGLSWSHGKGGITIGNDCCISENNVFYGAGKIEIQDHTNTAPGVMIFSSRGNYTLKYAKYPEIVHYFRKVTIGSYVKIFSNVVIAPGVTIGDGAVIGSCSFVSRDIPAWTVAAGNPARVIGERGDDIPLVARRIRQT